MQRGLVHALAWSLATGAAVTLSWWGVHTVMAGTAYDPPRAVPIEAGAGGGRDSSENLSSSTHRPEPAPSRSPSAPPRATASSAAPEPSVTASRSPSRTPAGTPRPTATASGTARSYQTDGGRIVFELGSDSAKLVSATPEQGWSVQVWTNTTWIRVNFTRDDSTTVSVFCTWNDHPPQVEIVKS
ncbi:hypothetical protein [Streptomyces sp. NPDC048332]|uniref:hypothetical protein n=1 Tax=unclassified Streptomyces TaxID=2593676 RepID=UPI0034431EEA